MSSIVISGDTSGTVTLQAPAVSGSTTITLPTVSGGTLVTTDSSGNVGIGTASPAVPLDVNGNVRVKSQGYLQFGGSNNTIYGDATANILVFATTANTERMRITSNGGISFGSSGTAYGSSGQILQSNGDAAPTWVNNGMTLLGTITPTAVNSLSLGSLTLTSYKSLFFVFNNLAGLATQSFYISSTNVQSGGGLCRCSANTLADGSGTALLDLGTGAIGGGFAQNTQSAATCGVFGGLTNVTTSSTIIYIRNASTTSFTAQGSILIYGVK